MQPFSKTKRERTERKFILRIVLLLMVIFLGSFLCTWSRMMHIHMGYKLANAYKTERDSVSRNSKLKSQVALLKSPVRIEAFAKDVLGMRYPANEQVVMLKK